MLTIGYTSQTIRRFSYRSRTRYQIDTKLHLPDRWQTREFLRKDVAVVGNNRNINKRHSRRARSYSQTGKVPLNNKFSTPRVLNTNLILAAMDLRVKCIQSIHANDDTKFPHSNRDKTNGESNPRKLEGTTSINISNLDSTVASNLDDHGASQFPDTMPQTINKGTGYERTSSSAIKHNSGRMRI
jgi:hypothetical protein